MLDTILFILLGIIIWQIVTFIVMCVTNENEEIATRVGCGLSLMIFNSIMFILRFIRRIYIRRNYTLAIIWDEKGSGEKLTQVNRVRIKKGTFKNYYSKGENQYYIEGFNPTWKAIEREDNIKHIRKNGWYCQDWINENLIKNR